MCACVRACACVRVRVRVCVCVCRRQRNREFQYTFSNTPHATAVYPPSSPLSSILRLNGIFFATVEYLRNILIGSHPCSTSLASADLRSDNCGCATSIESHCLCCRVEEGLVPGSYNITISTSTHGHSYNVSEAMLVTRNGGLRNYEHFPSKTCFDSSFPCMQLLHLLH